MKDNKKKDDIHWNKVSTDLQKIVRDAWKKAFSANHNTFLPTKKLEHIVRNLSIHEKSKLDYVTQYDLSINHEIISRAWKRFDFNIKSEEHLELNGETSNHFPRGSDHTLIVDPIDGTTNFINGISHFSTAIAVVDKNEHTKVGIVYNPITSDMHHSAGKHTSFHNRRKLSLDSNSTAGKVIILSDEPTNKEAGAHLVRETAILGMDARIYGGAQLDICQVALGKAAGYIKTCASDWDVVAGMFISENAGALCTKTQSNDVVVSINDEQLHKRLLRIVNSAPRKY